MNAILAPAAVLAAWSLIMLIWLAVARFSAVAKSGMDLSKPMPGGRRGADLEGVLPDKANWPAHNFAHLHEQPTVFYAICCILAITGSASGLDVQLAWGYVGLRVVHSLIQSTVNHVPLRFLLFLTSAIVLAVLVASALRATL